MAGEVGHVGQVMRGGQRRLLLPVSLAAVLLVIGGLVLLGGGALAPGDDPQVPTAAGASFTADTPDTVAAEFLAAWESEDWEALQRLIIDPSLDAAVVHAEAHRALRVEATTIDVGPAAQEGDRATVPADVTWDLGALGTTSFRIQLPLVRVDDTWRVRWWYPVVHPDLAPQRRFERVRQFRDRAPILGAGDVPLATSSSHMVIEVDADRVEDPDAVIEELHQLAGADPALVAAVLAGVDPDPGGRVAVLPLGAFEEIRHELHALPGVRSRRASTREVVVPGLDALLGSVGEITAEGLGELERPYQLGDVVGRSGLERAHERRLAGEPQQEARIVEGGQLVTTLAYVEGAAPEPVRVTLDPQLQDAARASLDATSRPAAFVAIDIPTGAVRAAVSTPDGELQRAITGRYAPGSTFKVVTAAASLARGVTPESEVHCPPVATFGNRQLRNAGGSGPGWMTVQEAMARSCNTALAAMAQDAGGDALEEMAELFGFDVGYDVGLAATGATYPATTGAADLAGAAIGQGQIEASPLHMASVAAAAVSGTWRSPHLIADVEVQQRTLPADIVEPLRQLLRAAVAEGTGRAADLPGEPVYGKTGSAQFGTGPRLQTHAWFIATRGDIAVAVVVEAGGGGGAVAAPIAARFFSAIEETPDADDVEDADGQPGPPAADDAEPDAGTAADDPQAVADGIDDGEVDTDEPVPSTDGAAASDAAAGAG
jgi:cell division protein FtsI/penicillin-binding protein 2